MLVTFLSTCFFLLSIGIFIYAKKRHKNKYNAMQKTWMDFLYPAASFLVDVLPEGFFGSPKILRLKYMELYGEKDCEKYIYASRLKTAAIFYLIIILFSFVIAAASYQEQYTVKEISTLERPEWGKGDYTFHAQAVMDFEGEKFKDDIALNVNERLLTEEEIYAAIDKTKLRINTEILGKNENLYSVYLPLKLYSIDENTKVKIQWKSDCPDLIDARGYVYSERIEKSEDVILTAQLKLQNVTEVYDVKITIIPFESGASLDEILRMKVGKMIEAINSSSSTDHLLLPDTFENIEITWFTRKENTTVSILVIMFVLLLILFLGKYEKLNNEIKRKRLEIEKDFPDFICKLVLLLNAGFIVQSALEKIADDYNKYFINNKKKPLYDELTQAIRNVKESNASIITELKDFASRSQVKEVMRFVAIISENIHLGSALTDKLQYEADMIWQQRKSRAEELGKIAEIKLTFPLVILLLVLMVIIMTPAFMEM